LFGPIRSNNKVIINEATINTFDGFDATIPAFTITKPE